MPMWARSHGPGPGWPGPWFESSFARHSEELASRYQFLQPLAIAFAQWKTAQDFVRAMSRNAVAQVSEMLALYWPPATMNARLESYPDAHVGPEPWSHRSSGHLLGVLRSWLPSISFYSIWRWPSRNGKPH
jgi:hypothetical protein